MSVFGAPNASASRSGHRVVNALRIGMSADPSARLVAPGLDLTLRLGANTATVTGFSKIDEVDRPEAGPLTDWQGTDALRMIVPVMLDGLVDDVSQQPTVDALLALARPVGAPQSFTVTGPLPLSGRSWWLDDLDWGDSIRNEAQVLVRQEFTLTLIEPVLGDVTPVSVAPTGGGKGAKGTKSTYTTVQGDTLRKIASKLYGDPSLAKMIGDMNGIRDTRKVLTAGRELRLPLTFGTTGIR